MGLGEFSDKIPFHIDSMDCSMESMESGPWNEHGIHIGLSEFSDKFLFHMDCSMESMDYDYGIHGLFHGIHGIVHTIPYGFHGLCHIIPWIP